MTNMGGMTKRWYDRKGGYDRKGQDDKKGGMTNSGMGW